MSTVWGKQGPILNPLIREIAHHVRTGNPLVDAAIRVLTSQSEEDRDYGDEDDYGPGYGNTSQQYDTESDSAKQNFLKTLVNMETGLFLILGTKGMGKTALSCRLLELYGERGKKMYALGMGKLPPHIQELEALESLPNKSAVIIDDTNIIFDNRSYASDAGKLLHKLITLSRQKDVIIIANSQQSAAVNRYLLQADAVFLKPQNALVAEYERGTLLKLVAEASRAFEGMSLEQIRSHVYAISVSGYLPAFKGLIEYAPPAWYGTNYSKSKSRQ